jgi:small subunit ribosomal protein S1
LIHISEISERRIEHPKEILHEGDVVTLRIIKIEEDTHRIGLSMRRVDSPAYTDLDWKTLTNEFDVEELSEELSEEIEEKETEEEQVKASVEQEEEESEDEAADDEAEDVEEEETEAENDEEEEEESTD